MRKVNLTIIAIFLAVATWSVSTTNAQAGKKAVFGGSGANAGWGSIGLITKEAMKSYGWDNQICSACAGAERAARLVSSSAVPPKGAPNDPPQPTSPLEFGATGLHNLWRA